MSVQTEPSVAWLRRQRRTVELELELMASRFDLEGALSAGQTGLAWFARQDLLIAAIELHLRSRGVEPAPAPDRPERICLLLRTLERLDPDLAGRTWRLLETPAAPNAEQAKAAAESATAFMTEELGVSAAASLDTATRAWAEAIKLLRSVAQGFGMAQAEGWYLSDGDHDNHLDWFDEVMDVLAGRAATT